MTCVLVTGGSGFIGSYVAKQLAETNKDVLGMGHGEMPAGSGFSGWLECDLTLDKMLHFLPKVETIFHCAGSGSVAVSLSDPVRDFNSNILTTQAVLEFARQRSGTKVVILSSAGVYGIADAMPISVNCSLRPISPYGVNKEICELLARQYACHFGVPLAIVRLFSVYGEGLRKQLLWDTGQKLLRGEATFFGTGNETRDWIHVEDAAKLLVDVAAVAGCEAVVVNGGYGRAVPIRDIVEGLAQRLNYTDDIRFTGTARPGDPEFYEADISGAMVTGWKPRIDIAEGLDRYATWFAEDVGMKQK